MAGLLTYSGFRSLPIARHGTTVAKVFRKRILELTAAGLFRILTGFPFHHFSVWISEPMRCKDTKIVE